MSMSASGGSSYAGSSSKDVAIAGPGKWKNKPNPVTRIDKPPPKKRLVQVIDYHYDQEKGDDVDFELRPADGGKGHNAVFTVTRSSTSSKKDVLDISQIIPSDMMDKFSVDKKPKGKFYRVKLKKKVGYADLDVAKYFGVSDRQLSSSDEDQKSADAIA